jgi:hypothetical protein
MFEPVPPTDPQLIKLKRIKQMENERGVFVYWVGIGRMLHWEMRYCDPAIGLNIPFWAYRGDEILTAGHEPSTDFWNVDILDNLRRFIDEHPTIDRNALLNEVGKNIAECLFKWPTDEREINTFQARLVNIRADELGHFTVHLPEAWRSSHG